MRTPEIDKEAFRKIEEIAMASKRIAVATHARADVDGLASSIIGAHILQALNPEALIHIFTDSSEHHLERFKEILKSCPFEINPQITGNYDSLDVFDCAGRERLGKYEKIAQGAKKIVNTDHHFNTMFGDVNVVRQGVAATVEIMYDYCEYRGMEIPKWVASLMCAGMLTDTGGLINNCDARSVSVYSKLIDVADVQKIIQIFNDNTKQHLDLLRTMDIQYLFDNRMFLGTVSQEHLKRAGADLNDTLALSDMGAQMQDIDVSAVCVEVEPERWRWSLRANDGFDISKIARQNGGGFSSSKVGAFPTKQRPEEVLVNLYPSLTNQFKMHPKREYENPFVADEPLKLKIPVIGNNSTQAGISEFNERRLDGVSMT